MLTGRQAAAARDLQDAIDLELAGLPTFQRALILAEALREASGADYTITAAADGSFRVDLVEKQ